MKSLQLKKGVLSREQMKKISGGVVKSDACTCYLVASACLKFSNCQWNTGNSTCTASTL